jgi:mRNA interferase HigB
VWILEERTLKAFWRCHADARSPLIAWIKELEHARFEGPADVRARHRTADFVKDKVVFNIGGTKYRLVVRFAYADRRHAPQLNGIVFVLFVGTHQEYDEIDVAAL